MDGDSPPLALAALDPVKRCINVKEGHQILSLNFLVWGGSLQSQCHSLAFIYFSTYHPQEMRGAQMF